MRGRRALTLPLAAGCAGLALWLALHHPLAPPLAVAGVLLVAAWVAWRPFDGLFLLPALLPVIDLMPWTGWLLVEEFDLLLLAVAAGLYGRAALKPLPAGPPAAPVALGGVVLALWLAVSGVALWRGVADAGGWLPGWWQGVREPMNALRLAKPALAVLLMVPAWRGLLRADAGRASDGLAWGMAAGHAAAALVCLWERVAFPGLLNFSADYRTTALFWETLTGGAGLDVYLGLTLPFTWWLLARARSRREFAIAAAVVALGFYAVLTTFSRIVFMMLPLSLLVFGLVTAWQRRGVAPSAQDMAHQGLQPGRWLPVMVLGTAGALLIFPFAGYRGLLAWLGDLLLLLLLGARWALPQPGVAGLVGKSLVAAVVLAIPAAALAWWLPKGPYLAYGLVWLLTLGLALHGRLRDGLALATAGWLACAGLTVAVAAHWSERPQAAVASAAAAVVALLLCWPASAGLRRSLVPTVRRGQAGAFLALVAVCGLVVSFAGGEQLSDRFKATSTDAGGRSQHWALSLGLRQSAADVLWGIGLGRFHDRFALAAPDNQRPGDIRWVGPDGAQVVRMVAGHHMLGWGELLRLSQRVARPQGPVTVSVVASSDQPVALHGEICVKHLLYDAGCIVGEGRSAAGAQGKQTLRWTLAGEGLRAAAEDPLRFLVFSLATESRMPITVHEVSARDAAGVELLHNGDFGRGAARWFVSSDRNHMPWHAKSLWVHLLVEQGLAGTAVFVLWVLLAVVNLLLGPGRRHPLAPALLAAIVGALVVGSIDSLLDMPRIAWLLTWLLAVSTWLAASRSLPNKSPHA